LKLARSLKTYRPLRLRRYGDTRKNEKKEGSMTVQNLLDQIKSSPETIAFSEVMECIDTNYEFTPAHFTNGNTVNEANQNNGSCKLFAFAKLQNLSKEDTLALFGDYYRKDVLENPDKDDHQNIRNFMVSGWDGIAFSSEALKAK
jgi:hypothetical protein